MNCYDHQESNTTRPAIGVCHECGVGICTQHGAETTPQPAFSTFSALVVCSNRRDVDLAMLAT